MTEGASDAFVKANEIEWEDVGDGLQRQILGYDSGLMVVRVRFDKGAVGELHHHPHRQVTYVEAGRFEVEIDGQKGELVAGDSFYVRPNASHGARALESGYLIDVFAPAREDFFNGEVAGNGSRT